ncbi:MAG: AbrB/MazE/SpoVT family DNA-binding domain-containing protein [Candidatus Dadabacteria bacterium]|nr:MAG: AbrB/MazE/SpoVT family DNA-binding domain-containing protein [Candidatus Dadabacteria bacterium]
MDTTRLSSKGQIVIPKHIRQARHWEPGTEFVIEEKGPGILLMPRKPFRTTRLEDGLGCAGYHGPPKTVEEMEEGIAAELRKVWPRGGSEER